MIIFSKHALKRMELRGITKERVIEAIKNPDIEEDWYNDRIMCRKKHSPSPNCRMELRVMYKRIKNNKLIITAYWQ